MTLEILLKKSLTTVSGQVYRTEADKALSQQIDAVSGWMAQADSPKAIVVDPAHAEGADELEAYRSLRRMAKTKGVDVHLVGDRSVEDIADRLVSNEDDLIVSAPGSSVGAQIADLMRSERMTDFERVDMDVPTAQELMKSSQLSEQEAHDKIAWMKSQAVWANNLYQVNIEYMPGDRAHLIIRRLDQQAVHNWALLRDKEPFAWSRLRSGRSVSVRKPIG